MTRHLPTTLGIVLLFILASLNPLQSLAKHEYGPPPSDLAHFVGDGQETIEWASDELTSGGETYFLVVTQDDASQRTLTVLVRERKGPLRVVGRNQTIIQCRLYGGTHDFQINSGLGFFIVENMSGGPHGASWQRFRFDWRKSEKKWVLTSASEGSDADDPEEHSSRTRTTNELGHVVFGDFDGDLFDVQWKNQG